MRITWRNYTWLYLRPWRDFSSCIIHYSLMCFTAFKIFKNTISKKNKRGKGDFFVLLFFWFSRNDRIWEKFCCAKLSLGCLIVLVHESHGIEEFKSVLLHSMRNQFRCTIIATWIDNVCKYNDKIFFEFAYAINSSTMLIRGFTVSLSSFTCISGDVSQLIDRYLLRGKENRFFQAWARSLMIAWPYR